MRQLIGLLCLVSVLGLVSGCGVKGDPLPRVTTGY